MKKSEIYLLAMCAIIESDEITTEDKVEILRALISDEELALFNEREMKVKTDATV